ncbi:MAG: VOC family protein [Acidobacteria bacterium]|nr:VOC family protein [Acidobacteriota bacterium]
MQRITPYLLYEDVTGALEWLARAFGFRECGIRMSGPDGKVNHAAMELDDAIIMMGYPGPDYKNPKRLGHVTQNLYVNVDDVDKHFEQARKAGAKILQEPEDMFYGDRRYGAEDLEGHHWYFAQHVRDVPPEEYMKQS